MTEYNLIDHTGDLGIEWEAGDLETLFEKGAEALAEILVEAPGRPAPGLAVPVDLDAMDVADLLVRFFQEILFRFEADSEVVPAVRVEELSAKEGRARLRGVLLPRPFDPDGEEVRFLVKAVTYHGLEAAMTPEGRCRARVLFDV